MNILCPPGRPNDVPAAVNCAGMAGAVKFVYKVPDTQLEVSHVDVTASCAKLLVVLRESSKNIYSVKVIYINEIRDHDSLDEV